MKELRRYLIASITTIGLMLAIIMAITITADPFHYFGTNWTGDYAGGERQLKLRNQRRYPHEGLLLGNSKVGYIDPTSLAGPRFFNAAFAGALPEEIYYYLRQSLDRQKLVVIGFDLEMFNEGIYPYRSEQEFTAQTELSSIDQLIGWPVLRLSIKSLYRFLSGTPSHTNPNGMANLREAFDRDRQMEAVRNDPRAIKPQLVVAYNNLYRGFRFSKKRLRILQSIRMLLDEHNIKHVVLINPISHHVMGLIKAHNLGAALDRVRGELRRSFINMHDFSRVALDRPATFFSFDPVHYKPSLGKELLNRALCDFANHSDGDLRNYFKQCPTKKTNKKP
jgi:hypothetical protein